MAESLGLVAAAQYQVLTSIAPRPNQNRGADASRYAKLETLLGRDTLDSLCGKIVIDFGCGEGHEAIEVACAGAKRVIGVDCRESVLEIARRNARAAGVDSICHFASCLNEMADVVISIDAFEHFENPAGVLAQMSQLLRPLGEVLISFGPTWYHPRGGHLFSFFPWAHLLFSEAALIRWRQDFKSDGARRFSEVDGGLNQMTIARFVQLVNATDFSVEKMETVPIRALRFLHNRLTREFTTSIVRCRLTLPIRRSSSDG
jgi:SAM-dependent methyltransferase